MNYEQAQGDFKTYIAQQKLNQFFEWTFWKPFSISVPANSGIDKVLDIKADGHFNCELVTGNFTTLIDDPSNPGTTIDDGANHLTIQILDGSDELRLFDGQIPLDLFLTPGRVLAAAPPIITGNPSNALFYPTTFKHIFGAKGGIDLRFKNNSDVPNLVNLLFMGTKMLAQKKDEPDDIEFA